MNKFPSIATLLILAACSNDTQNTQLVLYDHQVNQAPHASSTSPHSATVSIGTEPFAVPLKVTWTAGTDTTGCLRILAMKVERTGGDASAIVDSVRHGMVPCSMEFDGLDTTRSETAVISLQIRAKKNGKHFDFAGSVAKINGTGKLDKIQ